jgi:hypothetical protein
MRIKKTYKLSVRDYQLFHEIAEILSIDKKKFIESQVQQFIEANYHLLSNDDDKDTPEEEEEKAPRPDVRKKWIE